MAFPLTSTKAAVVLKRELRKKVRSALDAMSPSAIKVESEAVSLMMIADPNYATATTVGLYSSMAKEFDTSALLIDAFARNKRIFMPRVTSKERHEMKLLECLSMNEIKTWESSSWGIHEPPMDGRAETPNDVHLDLLIIPGVAFSLDGGRCGHGMGFYDTFLSNYARKTGKLPYIFAPALSPQLVDEVPMSVHDKRVNKVFSVRSSPQCRKF